MQYKHWTHKYYNATNTFPNPVKNLSLIFNMINGYEDLKKKEFIEIFIKELFRRTTLAISRWYL